MYTDWKIFVKSYIPTEEYDTENTGSRKLGSFIFFILLGFITSFSLIARVESKSEISLAKNPNLLKIEKIRQKIGEIETKNAVLESEILILNHDLTQVLKEREKKEIIKLSKLTGTHKKQGKGIIITLSDSDNPVGDNESPNFGMVHNTNLLDIINYLWAGGAQAISVNDQRITARTAISCIGPTILVNKTRIAPPFVIKSAGIPERLEKSLQQGYFQVLDRYGIKYSLEKYDRLEIPADGTIILTGDF